MTYTKGEHEKVLNCEINLMRSGKLEEQRERQPTVKKFYNSSAKSKIETLDIKKKLEMGI